MPKAFSNIFARKLDLLAIGDVAIDVFIRLKEARVHCEINRTNCEISMKFGDKIPFESATEVAGVGNSANAAVSLARLGLNSGLIAHVGKGANGQKCLESLKRNKVSISHVYEHNIPTNYHYVLWFEDERTILVKHEGFPYSLPNIAPNPKWVYLSSLSQNSEEYHKEILEWLNDEPDIKLCFQPGTFQLSLGIEKLAGLYKRAEVLSVNVEEAQRMLGQKEVGFTNIDDIKKLFVELAKLGPKIILITDGPAGAYMHIPHYETAGNSSTGFWYMPIYPDPKPPYERTGCGDAFASTFVAALILGKLPVEALEWAPVNPMSVVQDIGAQRGLLERATLEDLLKKRPDHFHAKPI